MTICDTCGGYYVRAPCPICTEEHIPESMAPTPKKRHKIEGSVEDQLRNDIESVQGALGTAESSYDDGKKKRTQRFEEQNEQIEELSQRKVSLAEKEEIKLAELTILKNKLTDLQSTNNNLQTKVVSIEQTVQSKEQSLKEKQIMLENLKNELTSLR